MELKIVEGWSRKASECKLLTVFEIEGSRRSPRVARRFASRCRWMRVAR